MIYLAAFWLAVIPPILAIFVECFNPINGRTVRANADRDLQVNFPGLGSDDRSTLLEILERSGEAIGETAGLAPTLIAVTTSGFAVLHELPSPFWPAAIYILSFIVLALYLLWLLSGLTFEQIGRENAAIPVLFWQLPLPFRRTTMVSLTIYLANIGLILLACLVFSR